ncbi:MAG: sigma-70 family RNA polymerase sigma factor [Planctomycetaceae bacterium]
MWDLPDTSHSLIARVKDLTDGAAWTEFLAIYRPVVYRMARRRGLQDADSQDLIQRVFLAISQAIDGWEPGPDRPPFRAWFVTVTRNAITKALCRLPVDRGAGSSSVMSLLAGEHVEDPKTTDELLIESRREALRWASDQVRPEFNDLTWRLFWETSIQGRSVAEVVATFGCSPGTVYTARFRVTRRLKEKVQEVSQQWDL